MSGRRTTPNDADGQADLTFVERAATAIGSGLKKAGRRGHVVVLRSTVFPGTTQQCLLPAVANACGLRAGVDFHVAFNPEFLREGDAVNDMKDPPKVIVGAESPQVADQVAAIYGDVPAPRFCTSIRVAEILKYVDNAFHALKVTFANEIGRLCRALDIESCDVMDMFTRDTKLNISPAYLRPGFAFGGSCLPKDLAALLAHADHLGLELPVLAAIPRSNARMIDEAVRLIEGYGPRQVGILGLSFKSGTDDLRGSPVVELVERLVKNGFQLAIHDDAVSLGRLVGTNQVYANQHIPNLEDLLHRDVESVVSRSRILVIGHHDPKYRAVCERISDEQVMVDLPRLQRASKDRHRYASLV